MSASTYEDEEKTMPGTSVRRVERTAESQDSQQAVTRLESLSARICALIPGWKRRKRVSSSNPSQSLAAHASAHST
jgi:hypothetical protein